MSALFCLRRRCLFQPAAAGQSLHINYRVTSGCAARHPPRGRAVAGLRALGALPRRTPRLPGLRLTRLSPPPARAPRGSGFLDVNLKVLAPSGALLHSAVRSTREEVVLEAAESGAPLPPSLPALRGACSQRRNSKPCHPVAVVKELKSSKGGEGAVRLPKILVRTVARTGTNIDSHWAGPL